MRASAVLVVALATALLAASAHARSLGFRCTSAPPSEWLPLEMLVSKVEALGYKVHFAKLANACGEFYAVRRGGTRLEEVFVDPTNGVVVGQH